MAIVAQMLREASCCVAYTGAGLSRAAGIDDYATKDGPTVSAPDRPQLRSYLDAEPTYAHRVLAAMEREGVVHEYVQQNHDGLPQKAGFPQEKINEIHGGWYDPSNKVVAFDGKLRDDLFQWMLEVEKKADFCLCLGTSLSGMNSDRIPVSVAKRMLAGDGLGTVVINLQKTHLDDKCAIRVWARIDEAFEVLSRLLDLNTELCPTPVLRHKYVVPYDENGKFDPHCRMVWNLSGNQEMVIQNKLADNYDCKGKVLCRDQDHHFRIGLDLDHHLILGHWWVWAVVRGAVPDLPVMNRNPQVTRVDQPYTVSQEVLDEVEAWREAWNRGVSVIPPKGGGSSMCSTGDDGELRDGVVVPSAV